MRDVFKHRWKLWVGLFLLFCSAYHFFFKPIQPAIHSMQQGTPPVSVATVIEKNVELWHEYTGRLVAPLRAQVRPRVSGMIESVHFQNGTIVKKGDLLFTVDQRPYLAEVERLEAELASTEARAQLAVAELKRVEPLMREKVISDSEYEVRKSDARVMRSNVRSARAALKAAKLKLEFTTIRAPISGKISRAELTVGNLVEAGSVVLATIVSGHPIYADFEIDEQTYLNYIQMYPKKEDVNAVVVKIGFATDQDLPFQGRLESFDNQLRSQSGTIRVRAVFNNEAMRLVPGLFVRVKLGVPQPTPSILIAERAIGTDQNKKFVLVVNEENTVVYREVKLGAQLEGLRIIQKGLHAGDRIIVSGLQRVRPGQMVVPEMVSMDEQAVSVQLANKAIQE